MKKVFKREMVAHVWAAQTQDEGRTPSGNFYFVGPTLCSYGSHFVVAHFLSHNVVLWNTNHYSNTTNRHQSAAREALRGLNVERWHVPGIGRDDLDGPEGFARLANRCIGAIFDNLSKASRRRAEHLRDRDVLAAKEYELAARGLLDTAIASERATAARKKTYRETLARVPVVVNGTKEQLQALMNECERAASTRLSRQIANSAYGHYHAAEAHADAERYSAAWSEYHNALNLTQKATAAAKRAGIRTPRNAPSVTRIHKEMAAIEPLALREKVEEARSRVRYWLLHAERSRLDLGRSWHHVSREARRALSESEDARRVDPDALTIECERAQALIDKAEHGIAWDDAEDNAKYVEDAVSHARIAAGKGFYATALQHFEEARKHWDAIHGGHDAANDRAAAAFHAIKPLADEWKAKAEQETANRVAAWRAGELDKLPVEHENGATLLRVARDGRAVETSRGAVVPVEAARQLWSLIRRTVKTGNAQTFGYDGPRVGSFRLEELRADGSVKVGCHVLTATECARMAVTLGFPALVESTNS